MELSKNPHVLEFYKKYNFLKLRNEWAWRTRAVNGRITGRSSEKYFNKAECEQNARDVSRFIFLAFKKSTVTYLN